jgi:hypothetical protein
VGVPFEDANQGSGNHNLDTGILLPHADANGFATCGPMGPDGAYMRHMIRLSLAARIMQSESMYISIMNTA